MQRKFDAGFRRYGQHGFHEICVGGPDVVGRILPVEGRLFHFRAEVVEIEFARRVAALFDHLRRVCVGGMEIVGGDGNSERAQIAQKAAVRFYVLIAARLTQLQPGGPVGVMHTGINLHAEAREALLGRAQIVEGGRRPFTEFEAYPAQPDLLEKQQIVVGKPLGVEAVRQFDVTGVLPAGLRRDDLPKQ